MRDRARWGLLIALPIAEESYTLLGIPGIWSRETVADTLCGFLARKAWRLLQRVGRVATGGATHAPTLECQYPDLLSLALFDFLGCFVSFEGCPCAESSRSLAETIKPPTYADLKTGHDLSRVLSTPNMIGRRFDRTMEMIPRLPHGSLKALLFPPLKNNVENKESQGVRARYGAELPPFIAIVRSPGRRVTLGMDSCKGPRVLSGGPAGGL